MVRGVARVSGAPSAAVGPLHLCPPVFSLLTAACDGVPQVGSALQGHVAGQRQGRALPPAVSVGRGRGRALACSRPASVGQERR